MFSHIMVGSNDLKKSKQFYDAVLGALGASPGMDLGERVFYQHGGSAFGVGKPINGQASSAANGGTIGFSCTSPEQVEAFHAAGVANGGLTCENPPGLRENGPMKMYSAYLRDPDGNKLCAIHRMG